MACFAVLCSVYYCFVLKQGCILCEVAESHCMIAGVPLGDNSQGIQFCALSSDPKN